MPQGPSDERCRLLIPRLEVGANDAPAQRFARLARWFDNLFLRGTFNGTILIARNGEAQFARSYGFADIPAKVPVTARTAFSLASVSKQFTGMAILLLRAQGRLRLDDLLSHHIPELGFYRGVTLMHLLHHTSGLPDYAELAAAFWDRTRLLTQADMIALIATHRAEPYFAPGDAFEYSNTGYALLGEVIIRASEMSFPDFMQAAIFAPLRMTDSAAYNLTAPRFPLAERAFGFSRDKGGRGPVQPRDLNTLDGTYGDGGLYASAADLLIWDRALRDGALLPTDAYREAYAPARLNDGTLSSYGFGWDLVSETVVKHWGEWEGFSAYLRRSLAQRTLLVLLSNLGPPACVDAMTTELDAFMDVPPPAMA
ncbi:MAG: serine hydrolase domain-containing protein [Variibacter sp.]